MACPESNESDENQDQEVTYFIQASRFATNHTYGVHGEGILYVIGKKEGTDEAIPLQIPLSCATFKFVPSAHNPIVRIVRYPDAQYQHRQERDREVQSAFFEIPSGFPILDKCSG